VDIFNGADIQSTGGLVGNDEFYGAAEFALRLLLLVTAGSLPRSQMEGVYVDALMSLRAFSSKPLLKNTALLKGE
jgi:hypothetical protein